VIPVKVNGEPYIVECTGIYYPIKPVPVEAIYTVVKLDPENGKVEGSIFLSEIMHQSFTCQRTRFTLPITFRWIM